MFLIGSEGWLVSFSLFHPFPGFRIFEGKDWLGGICVYVFCLCMVLRIWVLVLVEWNVSRGLGVS